MAITTKKLNGLTPYQQALQTATSGTNLRDMIRGGATEAELQAYNDTKAVPQSYLDRQGRQNYTFWNAGRSTIGDYGIDNSNAGVWRQAKALYDAGNVTGAMDLVNGLSAQGKFGGWYDDDGSYYGFAQGYQGGANASYLPVFGGNLIAKDVDTTGTNIWLTPDGKALHLGAGGALTDNGDTWSRTRQTDPVEYAIRQRETLEQGKQKAQTYIPDLVASGVDVPKEMYPYNLGYRPEFTADGSHLTGGGTYPAGSGIPSGKTIYEETLESYPVTPQNTTPQPTSAAAQTPYQVALSEAPQFTDPYKERRDAALERAESMEFNYDPNTDPVWQAYRKQYLREGKRATEDTLGRYAAMTGGMPSTAAVTAASQAGDYYASQLSDKLPQVYQDAYNRYLQEYQRQLGISDQYAQFGNTEYNRFEGDRAQWNKDRSYDYQRERDAILDQRYDQEWAQQLREYADSQNWKATEWQQYLREYGDKLSQQEREWAYKQYRDAVSDSQWNQEFNEGSRRWNLNFNTSENETAYQRAVEEAERKAKYGDMSGLEALGIDTSQAVAKEVAYADDGSTYKFSTNDALYFVQNAPNQSSMKGGDGSIWRKDEYGNVTIEKNGKTYRYGQQTGEMPSGKPGSDARGPSDPGNLDDDSNNKVPPVSAKPAVALRPDYLGLLNAAIGESNNPEQTISDLAELGYAEEDILNALRSGDQPSGQNQLSYVPGVRHNTPGKEPMTTGFQTYWPQLRNAYDPKDPDSRTAILKWVKNAVENYIIADYEADIIIDQLGLDQNGGK